jgi:cysteinyl-tRNA synthetase
LDSGKRNPSDILLWNSTVDVNEEYFSETLGSGMPWWHLQDSSIAISNFNGAYDIHGGAVDLIYPHHESHLAQLQALTSHQHPVKYWTHVGLLTLGANKMSKALGNAMSIRDTLKEYNSNILRLYMISNHYRRPLEFSLSKLEDFRQLDDTICAALIDHAGDTHSHGLMKMNKRNYMNKFIKCLDDDFDTPQALEVMKNSTNSIEASASLKHMVNIFGLRY